MSPVEGSPSLTTPRALLLVCLLWAGIYLPGLGSLPLKHEEPRRALPAVHMAATGDWLVPRLGATPYLRKPPLLNWLIALSFRASGGRSELAARLPSVLAMLALGLTVVITGRRWCGAAGALLAAIFVLTNLAAMETGRLAELEALYLSLTGIALMLWLTAWRCGDNPWWLWCAPAPFLALGMLTKGPAHLLFFYGVSGAILVTAKEWKTLLHPSHGVALLVTIGPFIAWAVPCATAVGAVEHLRGPGGAWGFWWREISSRVTHLPTERFPLGDWLLRVPQGFVNFLPWTVLLPLLWWPGALERLAKAGPRELALFRGARWGMVVTFLLMSLLPGGSARYVYPLFVVPSVLLARVLTVGGNGDTSQWNVSGLAGTWRTVNRILYAVILCAAMAMPFFAVASVRPGVTITESCAIILFISVVGGWRFGREAGILPLASKSAAGMVAITAIYALAAVPRLNLPRAGLPREVAASIRACIPAGQTCGVLDEGYHAFWYYLEPSVVYFRRPDDALFDGSIHYLLLPAERREAFTREATLQGIKLSHVSETSDGERHAFVLLARQATGVSLPPPGSLGGSETPTHD